MESLRWLIWWICVVLSVCCCFIPDYEYSCHALSFTPLSSNDNIHHHSSAAFQRLDSPKERASLNAFYATHFSHTHKQVLPPPAKETDVVYTLVDNTNNTTLAAVRLCPQHQPPESSNHVLLRSLCVSQQYRRQGLALKLIQHAMKDYCTKHTNMIGFYCFADESLAPLYHQAGFQNMMKDSNSTDCIPDWMWRSFQVVSRRMKRKHQDMHLFVKLIHHKRPIHMIILQHAKEQSRPTSTAPLLQDKPLLSNHIHVEIWTWSGKCDNEEIQEKLETLTKKHADGVSPILLWPGGGNATSIQHNNDNSHPPSFLVLDGTWQEAQAMYRKMPILQTLPRGVIGQSSASTFVLRNDYTGWKQRFGGNNHNSCLLCTVEVVAAVLENRGNVVGSHLIRTRLKEFQQDYLLYGKQPPQNEHT